MRPSGDEPSLKFAEEALMWKTLLRSIVNEPTRARRLSLQNVRRLAGSNDACSRPKIASTWRPTPFRSVEAARTFVLIHLRGVPRDGGPHVDTFRTKRRRSLQAPSSKRANVALAEPPLAGKLQPQPLAPGLPTLGVSPPPCVAPLPTLGSVEPRPAFPEGSGNWSIMSPPVPVPAVPFEPPRPAFGSAMHAPVSQR